MDPLEDRPAQPSTDPARKMAPCPERLRDLATSLSEAGSETMAALVRQVAAEIETR